MCTLVGQFSRLSGHSCRMQKPKEARPHPLPSPAGSTHMGATEQSSWLPYPVTPYPTLRQPCFQSMRVIKRSEYQMQEVPERV